MCTQLTQLLFNDLGRANVCTACALKVGKVAFDFIYTMAFRKIPSKLEIAIAFATRTFTGKLLHRPTYPHPPSHSAYTQP